jgi:hypothetical protein
VGGAHGGLSPLNLQSVEMPHDRPRMNAVLGRQLVDLQPSPVIVGESLEITFIQRGRVPFGLWLFDGMMLAGLSELPEYPGLQTPAGAGAHGSSPASITEFPQLIVGSDGG